MSNMNNYKITITDDDTDIQLNITKFVNSNGRVVAKSPSVSKTYEGTLSRENNNVGEIVNEAIQKCQRFIDLVEELKVMVK